MRMKVVLLVLGIGVPLCLLSGLFFQTILAAFVGGVVGGATGALVATYISQKERASAAAEKAEVAKRHDPARKTQALLDNLVIVNTNVRTKGLSRAAMSAVETIIDALRKLLPEMNEKYRGNDLTWEVNRSAETYLPNIVAPYLELTTPERSTNEAEFVESLGKLKDALEDISRIARENRIGEFSAKAKFLKARFATRP